MSDPILEFDEGVRSILKTLKGVSVHESVRDAEADPNKAYVVYFGNDVVTGAERDYGSIVGQQNDAFIHPFQILVSGPSTDVRNKIVAEIRRLLVGTCINNASSIRETGEMNGFGESDATLKPVKYTYFLTFSATIDRSDNE